MVYLYVIVRDKNGKLKKEAFQVIPERNKKFSDTYLCNSFAYVLGELNTPYSNGIRKISIKELNDFDRVIRTEAASFQSAIANLRSKYDVVAFSHRIPGWYGFPWKFNDKISFVIGSNFGYGSASYLCVSYYYNDLLLAPYSFYVKYRFSDYASVVRYTYDYKVVYDSWSEVMDDCMNFYNAIVNEKDSYIFKWLNRHLECMVGELEHMINAEFLEFWNLRENRSHKGDKVKLTGDDMWMVKSRKIAFSLDFVDNIQKLPQQVHPDLYIQRLKKVCDDFRPLLERKIQSVDSELLRLNLEFESLNDDLHENIDFSLYESLRVKSFKYKWYLMEKWERLRHLIFLKNRLAPEIHWREARKRIRALFSQIHAMREKEHEVAVIANFSSELHKSMNRMDQR